MSLFSSIQMGKNALHASQIGLQVSGNNIANANTPGYLRQQAALQSAPTQRVGGLVQGSGVEVVGIVQQVDQFLQERLRGATSDLAQGQTMEHAHLQLEAILGELGENSLGGLMNQLFAGLQEVLNQPESEAVRKLAVLHGTALADHVRQLDSRVRQLHGNLNDQVVQASGEINELLSKIARLNLQVVSTEGGGTSKSDAVGLRDTRQKALEELAALIDIRAVEQPGGAVTVYSGGDFLVLDGSFRPVTTERQADRGLTTDQIRLEQTDAPIRTASGKLAGLVAARDEVLGGFLDQLDHFARTLAFDFNKVHSSGQGLVGQRELTSQFAVADPQAALDQDRLPMPPVHGSFQVQLHNRRTGQTQTTDVPVELSGLDDDTTLQSLAGALDAIEGLSAQVTSTGRLNLRTDAADLELGFAQDTSGVLAALGLNTFFTGSSASDLRVSDVLQADPAKLAASRGGIGQDTENAVALARFGDQSLESLGGKSLLAHYQQWMGETAQAAGTAQAVAEGFRVFHQTLEGQHLSISGVSLDEEAVKMITYQRNFQAAARFISTVNDLLEVLIRM